MDIGQYIGQNSIYRPNENIGIGIGGRYVGANISVSVSANISARNIYRYWYRYRLDPYQSIPKNEIVCNWLKIWGHHQILLEISGCHPSCWKVRVVFHFVEKFRSSANVLKNERCFPPYWKVEVIFRCNKKGRSSSIMFKSWGHLPFCRKKTLNVCFYIVTKNKVAFQFANIWGRLPFWKKE